MYKKFTTKSGLRVVLAPRKDTETLTLSFLCGAGSVNENENNNGISHFIEHLMFKGTTKRPTTLDISKELDGVGAIFNAYTSKNHTNYYIKIASAHKELAFDILSDMVKNSKFDPADIEKERNVILEEMKMYEDNPLYYIEDMFEKLVFDGHELGKLIIGNRETLKKIDKKFIKNYLSKLYQPKNMVLVVAGNFGDAEIKKLINQYFDFPANAQKPTPKKFTLKQTKQRVSLLNKNTEQVNLTLGYPAYGYNHPDLPALSVLSVILGGNMSSRLFINIREKHGLCYFIKASVNPYQNIGNLAIQAGLDKSRIQEAIPLIIKELEDLRDNGATADELKRAKDFIAGQLVIQMEDSENVANYYGRQEILLDKVVDIKEKIKEIKKVSLKDIAKVAKDIIKKEKLNLAIIGPFKDVKVFERVVR